MLSAEMRRRYRRHGAHRTWAPATAAGQGRAVGLSLQPGHAREGLSPVIRRHPPSYGMQIAWPRRGGSGRRSASRARVAARRVSRIGTLCNLLIIRGLAVVRLFRRSDIRRAQAADTRHIITGAGHHTRRASSVLGLLCYSVYPMFSSCEMGVFRRAQLLSPLWAPRRVLRSVLVARLSKLTRVRRGLRGGQMDPARVRQEQGLVSTVRLLPSPEISPNLL